VVAESKELTVVDLEAGLENFSRGTPRHADTLLIVLEPYFKSLETGRRIAELGRELNTPRIAAVANKVRSSEDEAAIRQFAAAHEISMAAVIPQDDAILDADRSGRSPVDVAPHSPAVAAITKLAAAVANGSAKI
jgi:CO dehydrogenase maturation factor